MAQLSITVPDAVVPRILAAFNADTAAEVKAVLIDYIKTTVRNAEGDAARTAAFAKANAEVNLS